MKNFIDIKDFSGEQIKELLTAAIENKSKNSSTDEILSGKTLFYFLKKILLGQDYHLILQLNNLVVHLLYLTVQIYT